MRYAPVDPYSSPLLVDFVNAVDANTDHSWWPYTYTIIYCVFCKKDTGVRHKKWFGFYSFSKITSWGCAQCKKQRDYYDNTVGTIR